MRITRHASTVWDIGSPVVSLVVGHCHTEITTSWEKGQNAD